MSKYCKYILLAVLVIISAYIASFFIPKKPFQAEFEECFNNSRILSEHYNDGRHEILVQKINKLNLKNDDYEQKYNVCRLKQKQDFCLDSVKYNGQKYYDELLDKFNDLNIKEDDYIERFKVCEQHQLEMPVISSIKDVGPMKTIVSPNHFTYLLDDGKVLIADFYNKGTLQLFDPSTNTFQLLLKEGLTTANNFYYKTFIKLPDGNIQIANYKYDIEKQKILLSNDVYPKINTEGLHLKNNDESIKYFDNVDEIFNNGSFLYSYNCQYIQSRKVCEDLVLQDPINKITYKPAKLKEPRDRFKSILLPDNNILIIGGEIYDDITLKYIPSSLVELYNPITGTTEIIGNMSNPRSNPNAVVLKNGNIIITSSEESEKLDLIVNQYNLKTKQLKALINIEKSQLYQNLPYEVTKDVDYTTFIQPSFIKKIYYLPAINKIYFRTILYGFLFDPEKIKLYLVTNKTLSLLDYVMTPLKTGQILITGGGFNQNLNDDDRNITDRAYIMTFKDVDNK